MTEQTATDWNEHYPVGTPVRYWPGAREGAGIESVTRTPAWTLGSGEAVVSVEGYPGGILLAHVTSVGCAHVERRAERPAMTNVAYDPDLGTVLTCDTKGCHAQTTLGHTDPQTPLADLARRRGWHAAWRGDRDTRELRFSCPTHPGTGGPP